MLALNLLFGSTVAVLALSPCHAQTVAEFYKGKTIDIYIGTSVGGVLAVWCPCARELLRGHARARRARLRWAGRGLWARAGSGPRLVVARPP